MDKTVVIQPSKKPSRLLLTSSLLFLCFIISGLLAMPLLNRGIANQVFIPIDTDIGMFRLIWPEQPLGALEFIATKSLFVFAHQDPRSALNLWTLEYDSITLAIYALAALLGGLLIRNTRETVTHNTGLLRGLLGVASLVIAFTYMTDIEHCAGATWVGFVSLYGLGFSGFNLYLYYQGIFAAAGLGLLFWGFIKQAQTNR